MRMIKSISALAAALVFGATLAAQGQKPAPVPAPDNVAKPPAEAAKTASGLASIILQKGTGTTKPGPSDIVTVNYSGWTTDGKNFDSSSWRPDPSTFPLNRVIKGWGEGVQLMVVGEKRRFWIPSEIAYNGMAGRPQGMLVFDIELLDIIADPSTPPPDVAAPPKDARRTASGIAYKSLRPGKGGAHPTKESTVTVNYTGWTTDGKMFDTSIGKNAARFPLDGVIPGWTEGVQLMTVGEKMRFWIPEKMAYGGKSPPFGMLVFDVELIDFK